MTFIPIAKRSDLKEGVVKRRRLKGLDLLLVQSRDQLFVIENRCPHDDSPLARGMVNEGCIRCPKHRIVFELASGRALGGEVVASLQRLRCFTPVWQGEQVGIEISE